MYIRSWPLCKSCHNGQRLSLTVGNSRAAHIHPSDHNAVRVARISRAGRVFIPRMDGNRHNEAEDAESKKITAGCEAAARSAGTGRVVAG